MPEVTARTRTRAPAPTPTAKTTKAKSPAVVGPFLREEYGVATVGRQEGSENFETANAKARMIEALSEFLGVVHYACQKARVPRSTHYWWMKEDADYANAVGGLKDVALDFVEGQLLSNIRNGKELSTIFYLKTQGRGRGYIDRTEVTGADGGAIQVNMTVEQVKEDLPMEALQAVLLKTVFKGAALRPALPNESAT